MPVKDVDVLKTLLLTEEETETLPQGFEDDPMGFILKKYPGLNNVMEYMMTDSFREYVDAIFIVAPKPTTFKILLHNGQFFFLQFMGKAYQATVQGKNYYLMSIGEKERCMLAIARLLRYGNPLKTKGPEGAEQGTRPEGEEGGSGGEGGETAAAETPESGGEETPVTESMILENILKKSFNEIDKKSSFTKKDSESYKTIFRALEKNKGNPEKKSSKEIRISVDPEQIDDFIKKSLDSEGISSDSYKVRVILPKESGALSGSFKTYEITFVKDIGENIKSGEKVYLVNRAKESKSAGKTTIVQKSLTPVGLGISGEYDNLSQLIDSVKSAILSKQPALSDFLNSLIEDTVNSTESSSELKDIKSINQNIDYSDKTKKQASKKSPSDLSIIGKDFGEILGGIFLGKYSGIKNNIIYPVGNEPLVDFYIDGYKISSKYDKGAASSISDVLRQIDPKQLTQKSEKAFYANAKIFINEDYTSPDAFIKFAISEKMNQVNDLANIIGVNVNDLNKTNINNFVNKLIKGKSPDQKTKAVNKVFANWFKAINHSPGEINWERIKEKKSYGIITSPLSYYVVDELNKKPDYLQVLKTLVSKTEVKQMYLKFETKKGSMNFKIKSFNDPSASFKFAIPSISAYNPTASKLGFKMN